ncbi:MAG: cytochrome c family protein [Pseudomonadota bacterium]
MDSMSFNTIFGCFLAVLLVILGLHNLSHALFAPEKPHHGDHHGETLSLNEKIAATYAYYVEIEEAGGDVDEPEDVFDLGLALANADPARGESSFKQKCQSCHAIEQGGGNGIGPALWNTVGAPKAGHEGFRYSSALSGMGGEWTYENINDWLKNPSGYVSGTSMAFAGLNRDSERANVIAYMASMSENPPPFPEPLPAENETSETAVE